jgi:hypothetical protein
MLMTGKCVQIAQLPDGDHADKIFLMPRQRNLIGFLAPAKKNGNRKSLGIRVVEITSARWEGKLVPVECTRKC